MKRPVITVIAILAAGALIAGGAVAWSALTRKPLPLAEQCSATAGGHTTTVTIEQAVNAAIIAGVSVRRGLPPRAASIALATAYQESGIRNLNYGDADSLGLFQQRPSQGWGTKAQVMDPWYSSAKFYAALVKVKNWQTADINNVAQAVQRSAYSNAYRQHEQNARSLASSLTGQTPASFTCALRSVSAADPKGMASYLTKTYGGAITVSAPGPTPTQALTVTTTSTATAWSAAQFAVATAKRFGVASVAANGYSWTYAAWSQPSWKKDATATDATRVTITFAG